VCFAGDRVHAQLLLRAAAASVLAHRQPAGSIGVGRIGA
jgi:hypothetical protein